MSWEVSATVEWIAPGSEVVELQAYRVNGSKVYYTNTPAKIERLTATQVVLDSGVRYQLESYGHVKLGALYWGAFDRPAPYDPKHPRWRGRSLLVHPNDPRAKAAGRPS